VGGDRPLGLVVGMILVAAFVALPAAIVPAFYLFASIYGIVTGMDFSSGTMNVAVFFIGLVLTVATIVLATMGVVTLIGRALSPKNRPR
jgi:hypothetical protein